MTSTASSRKASTSEDKENITASVSDASLAASSAAALLLQAEKAEKEKISVKERTKPFNRMASETEVTSLVKQGMFLKNQTLKTLN